MIRFIKKWLSRRENLSSKTESAPADEAATDADVSTPSEPTAKPAIPDSVEVELRRRFNEFERRFNERQREILDDRAKSISWWLAVIAIVLTTFGIVIPIGTYVGVVFSLKEFEELKTQAQGYMEETKEYRDKSEAYFQNMPAEYTYKNPSAATQKELDILNDPQSSLMDKEIAKIISLQEDGKGEEAIKIWQGIDDASFEKVDRELAARALFSVGYLLIQQGKSEDAIDAYDDAIRLKPDYAAAYNNRGGAKYRLGRYEDAIADCSEAIRLKSNYAEAYDNRCLAKYKLERYDDAIADCSEAIRLDPKNVQAYLNRGNAKNELGQHDDAIADFDEAIRLKSNYAEAYFNRGNAKSKLGLIDEARQDLKRARDLAHRTDDASLVALADQQLRKLDNREGE